MTDHYNNCKRRKINSLSMLLISTGLAFFIGSAAFAQSVSSETEPRGFRYEEGRTFSMDIPARWISETPENIGEIARYSSNEEGDHNVFVFRHIDGSDDAAMRHLENYKRGLQERGDNNIVISEAILGSEEAAVIESERSVGEDDRTLYTRVYHLQKGKHVYKLFFNTDNKDMFELFEQMAGSIRLTAG